MGTKIFIITNQAGCIDSFNNEIEGMYEHHSVADSLRRAPAHPDPKPASKVIFQGPTGFNSA